MLTMQLLLNELKSQMKIHTTTLTINLAKNIIQAFEFSNNKVISDIKITPSEFT